MVRTVTFEVDHKSEMVQMSKVSNDSELSLNVRRAVREIVRHIANSAEISVTVANFYFKEPTGDENKVSLLFASNIQTEQPVPIL